MKGKITVIIVLLSFAGPGFSQGFVNLDFESAMVRGYTPNSQITATNAFPGWTLSDPPAIYDGISLGGPFISVWDTNSSGTFPIQGKFSAVLFANTLLATSISQTGLVPDGMESLTVDIYGSPGYFSVSLGGQPLTLIPMATGSTPGYPYTLYEAVISSFAGQVASLSFTALALGQFGSELIVDNIQFSSSPIPEPCELALVAFSALVFGYRRWRRL